MVWVGSEAKPRCCGSAARWQVLDQVRRQQPAEPTSLLRWQGEELVVGVCGQPAIPAGAYRVPVVIDADAAGAEVGQVTADTAADVENPSLAQQPAQVPTI